MDVLSLDIKKIIAAKYSANPADKYKYTVGTLKTLISNIRQIYKANTLLASYTRAARTLEYATAAPVKYEYANVDTVSISLLFWYLRPTIIKLVHNVVGLDSYIESDIKQTMLYDIYVNKELLTIFNKYKMYDLIIWWLQFPYFLPSNKHIKIYMTVYMEMIEHIISTMPDLNISEREYLFITNVTCMPYAISYVPCSVVAAASSPIAPILKRYHDMMRMICPWLNYKSSAALSKQLAYLSKPALAAQSPQTARLNAFPVASRGCRKILFMSDNLAAASSVFRDRAALIGKLSSFAGFDIWIGVFDNAFASYAASTNATVVGDVMRPVVAFVSKFEACGRCLKLSSTNIMTSRKLVESHDFDMVFYCDIGMRTLQTNLAYSRLAPIQVTTFGHSETSGIDTIDYFISSKWFHSTDGGGGGADICEKLVLTESLGMFYIEPHILFGVDISKFKTQEELGFGATDNIYGCLQTFQKINVDFIELIRDVLMADINATIILSNAYPYATTHLQAFYDILGPVHIKRLKWYNKLNKFEYLNLVSICRIVLDPITFGGLNTTFDALALGVPVITMRHHDGIRLANMFTCGIYSYIDANLDIGICGDLVVDTVARYVAQAVSICVTPLLRNKIVRKIRQSHGLLFRNTREIDEYADVLARLVEGWPNVVK